MPDVYTATLVLIDEGEVSYLQMRGEYLSFQACPSLWIISSLLTVRTAKTTGIWQTPRAGKGPPVLTIRAAGCGENNLIGWEFGLFLEAGEACHWSRGTNIRTHACTCMHMCMYLTMQECKTYMYTTCALWWFQTQNGTGISPIAQYLHKQVSTIPLAA